MVKIGKIFNEITFLYDQNPKAQKVYLAGTFTKWDPTAIPMTKNKAGLFKVRCKLPPGQHEYKFYVDCEWVDDPTAEGKIKNSFGTYNSIIKVK